MPTPVGTAKRGLVEPRTTPFESPWRYSEGLVICGAFVVSGAFVRRILRSQRARRSVQRSHAAPASRGGWRPGPTFASPGTAGRGDGHRRTPTPNVRGRLPDPGVNTAVPDGRNGADDKDFESWRHSGRPIVSGLSSSEGRSLQGPEGRPAAPRP